LGFQDGKEKFPCKTIEEPTIMLNHYFKINDVNLNSSVMYQFGKVANSNIDYQNANSPDPTYYRKMPSFTAHLAAHETHKDTDNFLLSRYGMHHKHPSS
jgi:hypothetical protein